MTSTRLWSFWGYVYMNNLCNHPTLTILSRFLRKWRSSLLSRVSNSMHVMRGIYIHDGSYVGCFTLVLLSASLPNFFTAERQVCRNLRQYWLKETCVLNICLPNSTMYCCDVCRQSPSLVFVLRESEGRLHTTPIGPPPAPRPPPGHHQWPMSPSPHGACDDSTTVELVYDLDWNYAVL